MISPFLATPPRRIRMQQVPRHLYHMLRQFREILSISLTPFESRPGAPEDLPAPSREIPDGQLDQCKWIYDQAESRGNHLEQKAQWTFGLIAVLGPLIVYLFVFLYREQERNGLGRIIATSLVIISGLLLVLGFISAMRAVWIKNRESLFIHAVTNMDGEFRKYSRSYYARGLLYCAAVNTALNNHIAGLVKAAHLLTGIAIIVLIFAAIPAGYQLAHEHRRLIEVKVAQPVKVSAAQAKDIDFELEEIEGRLFEIRSAIASTLLALPLNDGLNPKLPSHRHR